MQHNAEFHGPVRESKENTNAKLGLCLQGRLRPAEIENCLLDRAAAKKFIVDQLGILRSVAKADNRPSLAIMFEELANALDKHNSRSPPKL